jgi:hypothetical protein
MNHFNRRIILGKSTGTWFHCIITGIEISKQTPDKNQQKRAHKKSAKNKK